MAALGPGNLAPHFRLPDSSGRMLSLGRYKQKQPLVVVLAEAPPPSPPLPSFGEAYPRYRALGAEVFGIIREAPRGSLPFPVVRDGDGAVLGRLCDVTPAVLVLDSFGEIFVRWQGPSATRPDHGDILEWVFFTEVQCEECGIHAAH